MLTHENAVALSTRRGSALLPLLHPTCRDELAALGGTESWAVALRQLQASAAVAALRAANATRRSNDRATSAEVSIATLRPLLKEAGIAQRVPSTSSPMGLSWEALPRRRPSGAAAMKR